MTSSTFDFLVEHPSIVRRIDRLASVSERASGVMAGGDEPPTSDA